MKGTGQYIPVVLFIMLHKITLTFEILKYDHSNERYWPVHSCGTVYYAVRDLTFKILKCDHSNERFWAILSCGPFYYAVKDNPNF